MLVEFFDYENLSEEYIEKLKTLDVTLTLLDYELNVLSLGINFDINNCNKFGIHWRDVDKFLIWSNNIDIKEKIKQQTDKKLLNAKETIDLIMQII
ncbi:hypothetical protein D3C87_80970 [compost metagenome]